jgi:hypothetical protein
MTKLFLCLLFFACTTVNAQAITDSLRSKNILFSKKSWELSLVGSFNTQSVTREDPVDDLTIITFSVSAARYIFDCFSLEPEFTARLVFADGIGYGADYQLHINAGYTFRTTKLFHPYVKAGYGIGNTASIYYVGTQTSVIGSDEFDDAGEFVQCINTGAGIKWIIGSNAAIKTELNYRIQHYSYKPYNGGLFESGSGNEESVSIHQLGLLLGMSIFL